MIARLARCLAVALLLMLSACSAPRYADQAGSMVVAPASFPSDAGDEGASATLACEALADDALAVLIRQSLGDNLDLRVAITRLRQAQLAARASRGPMFPRLDTRLEGSRGTGQFAAATGGASPLGTQTIYQGSLAASYELDAWGRVRSEASAAQLDAEAAAETLTALRVSLSAGIAETWYALLAQRQLISTLEDQLAASSDFLELTRLRFGLGQAPAADVARQKQQTESLAGRVALARSGLAILEAQMAALAGQAPGTLTLPAGEAFPPLPAMAAAGAPAAVAGTRPDVRAAFKALEAADHRTAAALARRLPALGLSASAFSIERALAEVFEDALWSVGSAMSFNLLDGGSLAASAEAAEAAAEQALYEYAGALLQAMTEVDAALARNRGQDLFVRSTASQFEEAASVLELTRDAYRRGQASYLDVLTALQSWQSLERALIEATRDQFSNRIELCRSLGVSVGPDAREVRS